MDREKVAKGLQIHADGCGYRSHHCDAMECPYRYGDESCDIEEMCRDAIELLKEQEHKDKMFHALEDDWKRLKERLKEQEGQVQQWTKEIADNQLAHAPDELDRENWDYKKGIWDGLQIAWNIISEGR